MRFEPRFVSVAQPHAVIDESGYDGASTRRTRKLVQAHIAGAYMNTQALTILANPVLNDKNRWHPHQMVEDLHDTQYKQLKNHDQHLPA